MRSIEGTEVMEELVRRARRAVEEFRKYSQDEVDRIVEAVAMTVIEHRLELAELAVEETGIGLVEDKMLKIHYAAEYVLNKFRDLGDL